MCKISSPHVARKGMFFFLFCGEEPHNCNLKIIIFKTIVIKFSDLFQCTDNRQLLQKEELELSKIRFLLQNIVKVQAH